MRFVAQQAGGCKQRHANSAAVARRCSSLPIVDHGELPLVAGDSLSGHGRASLAACLLPGDNRILRCNAELVTLWQVDGRDASSYSYHALAPYIAVGRCALAAASIL